MVCLAVAWLAAWHVAWDRRMDGQTHCMAGRQVGGQTGEHARAHTYEHARMQASRTHTCMRGYAPIPEHAWLHAEETGGTSPPLLVMPNDNRSVIA